MRRIFILVFALSVLQSYWTFPQGNTYKLSGTVISSMNGRAIAGAFVGIVGTTRVAVTDTNGHYTVIGIPKGRYEVQADFPGSQLSRDTVFFDTIRQMEKDFVLEFRCRLDSSQARKDIEHRKVHLVINSGIVSPSLTRSDSEFQIRYGVQYDIRADSYNEPEPCLEEYYKIVFPYLDRTYGKSWRNEINDYFRNLKNKWKD